MKGDFDGLQCVSTSAIRQGSSFMITYIRSGTLITSAGVYLPTSLGNFLENSFQLGLAFWLKDITVPTVFRGSVVDSGRMALQ